jgi:exosome complex RNA-binding protein Rrp4
MKGTIELIGPKQVMIGVRTENDDFSVLELLGGYSPEIGDVISGALDDLGSEEVENLTQMETWDVYIQDIYGSKDSAWKLVSKH